jgi:hypothetical protein
MEANDLYRKIGEQGPMTVKTTVSRRQGKQLRLANRLAELQAFVAEHGRLPREADHRGLADWVRAQLKSRATDPEYVHVREEVERIHREVGASNQADATRRHCAERLQALRSFVAEHERLPSPRTGDTAERALAKWMQNVNSPDRVGDDYDQARAEVRRLRVDHGTWTKHLTALKDFVAAHDRLPTFAESPTGIRFIDRNTAMLRAGKLSLERAAEIRSLTAMRPTMARAAEWQSTFGAVAAWVDAHGNPPRRRSTDPEELRLANWLNRNRQNERAGVLSPTQSKLITGLESYRPATWRQLES